MFWGLPPSAAGPLHGSQVCSALRFFRFAQKAWSAAARHHFRPLGRRAFGPFYCRLKPTAKWHCFAIIDR
ncbi:hypothetical protein SGRA_4002 [Saprospira grandis str. Lewin]|uniref:Uncharacterized protein n=1 Tax=Saprospira grandis (strain Lewin) TaxID=984262 RepID=H6L8J2_SAPGL|nr:hypothetical protein SGRA_4002 [Saprospira grandis str. Lewin]